MKKFIVTLALLGTVISSSFAASTSIVVLGNTYTNLFAGFAAPVLLRSVTVVAATNAAASALIIDAPTNQLVYVNAAYTNSFSYMTNFANTVTWTNYYGVVQSNNWGAMANFTAYQLVDVTNNLVAATTNAYPIRLGVGAAAGASTVYTTVNTTFTSGIWATNTSTTPITISLTW